MLVNPTQVRDLLGHLVVELTPNLNLRAHVFSLSWMWRTGKSTVACMRGACCKNAPSAVEAMELQGLPNGNALHL